MPQEMSAVLLAQTRVVRQQCLHQRFELDDPVFHGHYARSTKPRAESGGAPDRRCDSGGAE